MTCRKFLKGYAETPKKGLTYGKWKWRVGNRKEGLIPYPLPSECIHHEHVITFIKIQLLMMLLKIFKNEMANVYC